MLLFLPTLVVGEQLAAPALVVENAADPAPVAEETAIPVLVPDSNIDISFFIVEHSEEEGSSHRFSADKVSASADATLQDFSMFFETIMLEREIGTIMGAFKIGDEIWSFTTRSVVKITSGRLIVNTKLSVRDKEKGSTELISKEPYRTTKVIGNKEQNVTEFIDVGVKIEALPIILPGGVVQTKMKMSISEVLRENDRSRETRVPIVSFRTVDTSMNFTPGQLELLSELTIAKKITVKSGLPFLRNIPYLGPLLFTHSSDEKVNTRLYIVGGVSAPQKDQIEKFEALKKQIEEENHKKTSFK
jgi:general secretion pathway protein D